MSEQDAIIDSLHLNELADLLQEAGYRTNESEHNGSKQLLSASQGIGFSARPGNMAGEGMLDFTLSCALRIQGDLPAGLIPAWNRGKRFSRLSQHGDFLVLEMDVIAAGGVRRAHLRTNLEIWDHLLREFLLYLRNYREGDDVAADASPDDASVQEQEQDTQEQES